MDYKKVSDLVFEGIDHSDYPEFCDAHVVSGMYDGEEMSDEMIDDINDNHREFMYQQLMDYLF
jgi:hypothetical protein